MDRELRRRPIRVGPRATEGRDGEHDQPGVARSQVAPEWAFARTRSKGFVTVKATGHKGLEANQELFVLQKQDDGKWKIAQYIFSTTNPPRQ